MGKAKIRFDLKTVEQLAKQGRIRGFSALPVNNKREPASMPITNTGPKIRLSLALEMYCRQNRRPLFFEQVFHVKRKWRFDFLIPGSPVVAIEYEGIHSAAADRNGHQNKHSYAKDVEKYREAALQGITVLRYTAKDVDNIISDLKKIHR